jgi:hypothetical protein
MHRKEIAKFQMVIISFIRKGLIGSGIKILFLKKLKKKKKKKGRWGWTKKNGNKFRSLSFEQ